MSRVYSTSTKSGPGETPALLHGGFGHGAGLEGVELLGALAVQRHLGDAGEPVALQGGQAVGLEDGDLALDEARVLQALDAAQAGGRRYVHLCSQGLVALGRVGLEQVKQLQVNAVQ